jgi:hypothetical protein
MFQFNLDGQIELYADGKKTKTNKIKNYFVWTFNNVTYHIAIKDGKFTAEKIGKEVLS